MIKFRVKYWTSYVLTNPKLCSKKITAKLDCEKKKEYSVDG